MRRLEEIRKEEASIRASFPELFRASTAPARGPQAEEAAADIKTPRRRRRKTNMSPSARKAVSERMKKYWADRRKASAKAKQG